MTDSTVKADGAVEKTRIARHWAIPVLLLAGHLGVYALHESGPAIVAAPLLVLAAFRLWTGNGRRRVLGVEGFLRTGAGRRGDRIQFAISLALTLILLLAAAGRIMDAYRSTDLDQRSDDAVASALTDVINDALEEQTAIHHVLQVHNEALNRVLVALDGANLTDDRRATLRQRTDFIEEETRQLCRLSSLGDVCIRLGVTEADISRDAAERARILEAREDNAELIAAWD